MEEVKLIALRDFGIAYSPWAQHISRQHHATQDNFHVALYGTAALALSSPTATAIEQAATRLIQAVMRLLIKWDDDNKSTTSERVGIEQGAVKAAQTLCTLTSTCVPWLTNSMMAEPIPPALAPEPIPKPIQTSRPPALVPGIFLSTKEAADYLNMKAQTLHKWASTDSGPIRPLRTKTRRLAWKSEDIIQVLTGK